MQLHLFETENLIYARHYINQMERKQNLCQNKKIDKSHSIEAKLMPSPRKGKSVNPMKSFNNKQFP
jgi:hypothetical protein